MADARTEAVEAMATRLLDKWVADHECDRSDDALAQATDDAEAALDAIPTAALVRLVIERGGLEHLISSGKALLAFLDGYAVCRGCGVWVNRQDHKDGCLTEALRAALDRIAEEPT